MRPQIIDMDLADVDANSVFEDQQLVGAGNFSLDGTDVTDGVWTSPDGFARQISFESAGNLAARTFTITGYRDPQQNLLETEDVTGPNNETVEGTKYFYSITQIASDGAVASDVECGFVDEATTQVVPLSWRGRDVGFNVTVTGTIDYTVQQTFDDITSGTYPTNWDSHDDSSLVNATATFNGNYVQIPRAMRVIVNSYSSGAELQIGIHQQDV